MSKRRNSDCRSWGVSESEEEFRLLRKRWLVKGENRGNCELLGGEERDQRGLLGPEGL